MKSILLAAVVQVVLLQVSGEIYYNKFVRNAQGICEIISQTEVPHFADLTDDNQVKVYRKNAISTPYDTVFVPNNTEEVIETYSRSKAASQANLDMLCIQKNIISVLVGKSRTLSNITEVRKVVDNGDPKNRIDVVFMGDGYTAAERNRFFGDLDRLTKDMFEGATFKSWLPLFNIWGIHVPSVDSGIGYNGPKKTPFLLFRDKGQLRGIFTGNPSFARATCLLTGPDACDYPSLLGNDDYYGGLGGEFVISTRSERTGTIVLRHEMGHNFVKVGEEYDNGQVYDGVNSAPSLDKVEWKNWLTGSLREEREIYRLLEYPWHDLSKGPKSFNFTSDGKYSKWYLQTSVTAAGETDSLEFILDGKVLAWQSRGSDDREFYDWNQNSGFSAGQHTFTVRSKTTPTNKQIPRMFASVSIFEYGNESEFVDNNEHYSAYPTWDIDRKKTYRPTKDQCLMRNMTSNHFCNVCKEGMWYQFLNKITLIDEVKVNQGQATVYPLKLGQLRPANNQIPGERLEIKWYQGDQLQDKFNDKLTIPVTKGPWKVTVELITPEVRSDPKNLLTSTKEFLVLID